MTRIDNSACAAGQNGSGNTTTDTVDLLQEKLSSAFILEPVPLQLARPKTRRKGNPQGGGKGVPTHRNPTTQALKCAVGQLRVGSFLMFAPCKTKHEQTKLRKDVKSAINLISVKSRRKFKVNSSRGIDPMTGDYTVSVIRQDGRSNPKQRRARKRKALGTVEEIVPTKIVETEETTRGPANYEQILRRFSCLITPTQPQPVQFTTCGSVLDDIVI